MDKKFLKIQQSYERLIKKKEKGIAQNYGRSFKRLRKEVEKIYDDAEKDGELNYSREDVAKLDKKTADIMLDLYRTNTGAIENTLKQIAQDTREASVADSIVPIKKTFDPSRVIHKEVAGRIWTERIDHYGDNFVYDVHSIIKAGLERGDTYTTMGKSLRDRFGSDVGNVARIARTEGARVLEDTKFDTFSEINKNSKIKMMKVWRTMQDEAVRSTHQAMEGVEVELEEEFVLPSGATCLYPKDTGFPEEDINCRCYCEYKPVIDDGTDDENGYNTDGLAGVNTFDEMASYFKTKNIVIDDGVRDLDFKAVKRTLTAIEEIAEQYPDAYNRVERVSTSREGVMSCSGRKINFNPKYYKDTSYLENRCKELSLSGWWHKSSSLESLGVHEFGHAVNWDLIAKNEHYDYDFQRILDWNDGETAKRIVSKACKDIKKTPYGKGKVNATLRKAQSIYEASDPREAIAESFADVYANKENANPLSVRIIEIIDDMLKG